MTELMAGEGGPMRTFHVMRPDWDWTGCGHIRNDTLIDVTPAQEVLKFRRCKAPGCQLFYRQADKSGGAS